MMMLCIETSFNRYYKIKIILSIVFTANSKLEDVKLIWYCQTVIQVTNGAVCHSLVRPIRQCELSYIEWFQYLNLTYATKKTLL